MQKYPFNDESMTYDYANHMYILTPRYVEQELGINMFPLLNTDGDVNNTFAISRTLRNVSRSVYNWYYMQSINNAWQEYAIAKSPTLRRLVLDALFE